MNKPEIHIVPKQESPKRLSDYAIGIFAGIISKAAVKKAIKKELIEVDGKIASTGLFIKGGEKITYKQQESKAIKLELKLEVLFEDDHLAIIIKPAGILVSGNKLKTIANALAFNLNKSPLNDALETPLAVHRLDFPTSGLLLIGKTSSTVIALNKMFENKEIHKTYHAIAIGQMQAQGQIISEIGGKYAETEFEVIESQVSEKFEFLNLVKLNPKTGRRHQLRIHLSEIGSPILGDKEYGKEGLILQGKGLYLHASSLAFVHPITSESIIVNMELPAKFARIFF